MPEAVADAERKRLVYRRVAELHVACLDRGFLASLGPRFLALLYQSIDEGSDSVLLVSRDEAHIVGFVAGTLAGMGPIYRGMLRHWPALMTALLPSLVSPRRLWRMLEIVAYSGGGARSAELPVAELLSIGVDGAARGKGHAAGLYQELCDYFRNRHVGAFKIVVGQSLQPAHRFYCRMGARPVSELEVHSGEASTVYVHALK